LHIELDGSYVSVIVIKLFRRYARNFPYSCLFAPISDDFVCHLLSWIIFIARKYLQGSSVRRSDEELTAGSINACKLFEYYALQIRRPALGWPAAGHVGAGERLGILI